MARTKSSVPDMTLSSTMPETAAAHEEIGAILHMGGSRIDEIGELGTGDAVAIRHGTHDAADGEAVKIVVHKNQHAEKERSEHRAGAGVHILFRPASVCVRTPPSRPRGS